MKKAFALILILSFALCVHAQSTYKKDITVKPFLELQNYEHFKRLVTKSDDIYVEYIEGFDLEWGYTYKLRVEVTKLSPELSDGTQYTYKLDSILSKTQVSDSMLFRLFIDPKVYYGKQLEEDGLITESLQVINDSTFLYFDEVEIEVPKALLEKFIKVMQSEHGKIGQFVCISGKRIRLVRI